MLTRLVDALARIMAILGGLVLGGLVVMTCLSIAGRFLSGLLYTDPLAGTALAAALLDLGIGPIDGDFELIEAGMAFAIFAFLPITQLRGAHASVDVFTARMGPGANRVLGFLWSGVFAGVLILVAWQLWLGTEAKMRYGETTYLIQFPIWWAYAAALTGAVVAALVAIHVAVLRLVELATGQTILPADGDRW
ncbi:TRAP transporter small permease [uncultured Jannaschia sp.]|uniref:TRAP transporter small permease n=1 Tax=uncultured Jannaschia sp. TaxID=293347 RepID=UPI002627DC1D|nr:TRAP transporter small permease [uncultured Jannaschia sp.]